MSDDDHVLSRLLSANAQWAADVNAADPKFFADSSTGQWPKVLWIGCADSRVPESVITASKPGEIFVHRNIANQFHLDDDSILSVLTYAVEVLGVKHIIIVGHTLCGGAAACYKASQSESVQEGIARGAEIATVHAFPAAAPINRWLAPLTKLAASLAPSPNPLVHLVEENVRAQVANVLKTESGRKVRVHGWVYEIEHGRLRDLCVPA